MPGVSAPVLVLLPLVKARALLCIGQERSTGHGSSEVRKLLTLCARSAGTHHAKYRRYKERKLAAGKASELVTNNMINKLIRVVCAVWNEDAVFDPNHVSRFAQNAIATP